MQELKDEGFQIYCLLKFLRHYEKEGPDAARRCDTVLPDGAQCMRSVSARGKCIQHALEATSDVHIEEPEGGCKKCAEAPQSCREHCSIVGGVRHTATCATACTARMHRCLTTCLDTCPRLVSNLV